MRLDAWKVMRIGLGQVEPIPWRLLCALRRVATTQDRSSNSARSTGIDR